tara:strand:+ start:245 stop:484 length:240 start_codon:yes stop_codon:yes gene_type:complete
MTKKDSEKKKNYSNKFYGYTGPVKPHTPADRASAAGELDWLDSRPWNKSFSPLKVSSQIIMKGFAKDNIKGKKKNKNNK